MKPVSELLALVRSAASAKALAERLPQQDVIVAEPWEKGREYRGRLPIPPNAVFMTLPRTANQPVPMGRDARAVVQLDHAAVSRLHAVLAYTGQGWKVMDRSSNGSWVEEEKLPAQTATPIAYGANLRLGRAMVVRVLTPEGLHELAAGAAPAPAAPPAPARPPADPRAQTARIPAVRDSLFQPEKAESKDELDLDLGDPNSRRSAPTVMIKPPPRGGGGKAPPPAKKSDDIEFEFDLDFGDGKGGFA